MANYTISKIKRSEGGGTTTARNQTGVMTITPKPGYVVGHADFAHGTLPSGVSGVVFATVGTAFTVGATVTATVTIASDFTMSSADTILSIPITGNARKINATSDDSVASQLSSDFNLTINNNLTGVVITSLTSSNNGVTAGSIGDGTADVTLTGAINYDPQMNQGDQSSEETSTSGPSDPFVEVAEVTVAATGSDVISESDLVSLTTSDLGLANETLPDSAFTSSVKSVTTNSNGEVTGAIIKIFGNTKQNILSEDALTANIIGKSRTAVSTTKELKDLKFGDSIIGRNGATRDFEVLGTVGATFELNVTEVGGSSILDVTDGVIPQTGKSDLSDGVYKKTVTFPASTSAKSYSITLTETGSTTRGSALGNFHDGYPSSFTINQYKNPVFTMRYTRQTSPSPGYSALTETTVIGRPNKAGSYLNYLKGYSDVIDVSHVITTSTGSFTFNSTKLDVSDASLFITGDVGSGYTGSAYDPSKVSIIGLTGKLSTTSSSNDTLTMSFKIIINSWGTSDLTYQMNIPHFLTHGS